MKRLWIFAGLIFIISHSVSASLMGPVNPRSGFKVGAEAFSDEIILELETGNSQSGSGNRARGTSYLGSASYGFNDRLELTLKFGLADLDILNRNTSFTPFGASISDQTWDGDFSAASGASLGGILYASGAFSIAANANVLMHADHSSDGPMTFSGTNANGVDFTDWNVGIQIQNRMQRLYPYVGVRLSGVSIQNFENKHGLGVYVGTSYDISEKWSATLEGQLIDRTSFGGGVTYAFGQTHASIAATEVEPRGAVIPPRPRRKVPEILAEAKIAAARGETAREEELYREAVGVDPKNVVAVYNLASVRYVARDYREAGALYERVVNLAPNDIDAWLYLGMSETKLGRTKSALRAFKRVLALDPGNTYAWQMVTPQEGRR